MVEFEFHGGRKHAPDERDLRFLMREELQPVIEEASKLGLPPWKYYPQGPVLDQGQTGTCVAHGWAGQIYAAPIMVVPELFMRPYDLYRQIVKVDEWSDNDWEATAADSQLQGGTSVRAGAKVLQSLGLLKSYVWTLGSYAVEDMRAWHLSGKGTNVLGITWKSDMMEPDSEGVIRYTGNVEGGHCIKTTGWKDNFKYHGRLTRAARILNSWGEPWGEKGRAWIIEEDLANMIADDGEVCAPIEQKLAA